MAVNAAYENRVWMLVAVDKDGQRTDVLSDELTRDEALARREGFLANGGRLLRQMYGTAWHQPVTVEVVPRDSEYGKCAIDKVRTRDIHEVVAFVAANLDMHGYRMRYEVRDFDWSPAYGYTLDNSPVDEFLVGLFEMSISSTVLNERQSYDNRRFGWTFNEK